MVGKISEIKNMILQRMDATINERGVDRADTKELGELSDIVKDLAQAEKECWEAEYYMAIAEGMGSQGYTNGTNIGSMPYNQNSQGYRDSRGRYARRPGYTPMGYHGEIEGIREAMQNATPEEREKMQRELRQIVNM